MRGTSFDPAVVSLAMSASFTDLAFARKGTATFNGMPLVSMGA
jgi:hypothetical protein